LPAKHAFVCGRCSSTRTFAVTSLTRSSLFDVTGVAVVLVKGGCGRIWNGIHLVGGAPSEFTTERGWLHPRPEDLLPGRGNTTRHARCDRQASDPGGKWIHSAAKNRPASPRDDAIGKFTCRCDDKNKPDHDHEPGEVGGRALRNEVGGRALHNPEDCCCHSEDTSGNKQARDSPVEEVSATSHWSIVREARDCAT